MLISCLYVYQIAAPTDTENVEKYRKRLKTAENSRKVTATFLKGQFFLNFFQFLFFHLFPRF